MGYVTMNTSQPQPQARQQPHPQCLPQPQPQPHARPRAQPQPQPQPQPQHQQHIHNHMTLQICSHLTLWRVVLCENSGTDVEWLMDNFSPDLSLVARPGSHSVPRNPSRQGAFPRHDHHLCPDSDCGEDCRRDRQGEDHHKSACHGVDCEWKCVHWLHLREGRSFFQGVWTRDFRQRRLQCGFQLSLQSRRTEFLHSWSYPVPHQISKICSLFSNGVDTLWVLSSCPECQSDGIQTECQSDETQTKAIFQQLFFTRVPPWEVASSGQSTLFVKWRPCGHPLEFEVCAGHVHNGLRVPSKFSPSQRSQFWLIWASRPPDTGGWTLSDSVSGSQFSSQFRCPLRFPLHGVGVERALKPWLVIPTGESDCKVTDCASHVISIHTHPHAHTC